MKKIAIAGFTIIGIFILFFGGVYLYFTNLDFVGTKDPETVKKNTERAKKELLRARFFNANEVCEITLADSSNVQLLVGNSKTYHIIFRKYTINLDTIIIRNGKDDNEQETAEIAKMIPSQKMLLDGDHLLFDYNSDKKKFSTSRFMQIEMNKLD